MWETLDGFRDLAALDTAEEMSYAKIHRSTCYLYQVVNKVIIIIIQVLI